MAEEQKNSRPEVTPDFEVLYTESFARERALRSRRGSLFFGIGAMILGSYIVHDTVIAIRNGKLVAVGRLTQGGIYLPPYIAGPIGVFALSRRASGFWQVLSSGVSENDFCEKPKSRR